MDVVLTSLDIITPLSQESLPALQKRLATAGFRVLTLDGAGVRDAATLWAQAARYLPWETAPPPRSWSGFSDGLWGLLGEVESNSVALLWLNADGMLVGGLGDLLLAADTLTDLARQVYDRSEMVLKVFLLGEGPNFPLRTF